MQDLSDGRHRNGFVELGGNYFGLPRKVSAACLGIFPPFDLFDLEGFDPGWRDAFQLHALMSPFGGKRTWSEVSMHDPKRTFGRHLGPRTRRMMPTYPPLLDAVVLWSGRSMIAARSVGEHGRQGFPVTGGQGH